MAGSETPFNSNADFRKLLETPRADRSGSSTLGGRSVSGSGSAGNRQRKSSGEYKPKPKPFKKPTSKGDEDEDPDAAKYR